jgi:capsular exopolysaccharide synthesis family protein
MNIKEYIAPLLRWWWLLILAMLVAGVSSYLVVARQQPQYQSRSTLMIGQAIYNPNPSSNQFYLEQQLAAIYADMGTREPVRKGTMDALGLSFLPQYVVRALPNTQMVEITVTDTNPFRAQAVASELANQLVQRTPNNLKPQDQERQIFIETQLNTIQADILTTQKDIEQKKLEMGNLNGAQQISEAQRQITSLETKLSNLQSNYTSLLANSEKGALNTVSIIEIPEVPTRPIGPNKAFTVILAALIGMSLAAGGAYAIEFFDQTIKSRSEAERLTEMPMLIGIPSIRESTNTLTHVLNEPYSAFADAFRLLRTDLEIAGLGTTLKTIVVISPGAGDGKTTVASNLMLAMAESKKRAVLVDADFYQSTLEKQMGKRDQREIGNFMVERVSTNAHLVYLKKVLSKGNPDYQLPINPSELLNSPELGHVLEQLRAAADVVIIDSPPFILSDALVLSMKADAVLVVINQNHTRRDLVLKMKEQLKRANVKVIGFTMNNLIKRSPDYYSYYYHGDKSISVKKTSKNPLTNLLSKLKDRQESAEVKVEK